jgi:hypothetical protein
MVVIAMAVDERDGEKGYGGFHGGDEHQNEKG